MGEGERDVRLPLFVVCYVGMSNILSFTVFFFLLMLLLFMFIGPPRKRDATSSKGHPTINLNPYPHIHDMHLNNVGRSLWEKVAEIGVLLFMMMTGANQ